MINPFKAIVTWWTTPVQIPSQTFIYFPDRYGVLNLMCIEGAPSEPSKSAGTIFRDSHSMEYYILEAQGFADALVAVPYTPETDKILH